MMKSFIESQFGYCPLMAHGCFFEEKLVLELIMFMGKHKVNSLCFDELGIYTQEIIQTLVVINS